MIGSASAPASSGNLGPGFDSVALALELRCTVTAEPSPSWRITERGASADVDEDDYVVRAVSAVVGDPMHLRIENAIPRSRGLGSSSAVAAAAACAALRATGKADDMEHLFDVVCRLEGHADNAAAAVYGGLVLTSPDGTWRQLEFSPMLRVLVAVTGGTLSTRLAREALPEEISMPVAARSVARAGFLIEGLRTGDPAAFVAAGGDELHELPRKALSPLTADLMEIGRAAGALHVAWSGAGPSVIALCQDGGLAEVAAALEKGLDDGGEVLQLEVADSGVI